MSNWLILKAAINAIIKENNNQEITGQLLQNALNNIISALGENYTFIGKAYPTTSPGIQDGKVFYLATGPGTYANFSGIELDKGLYIIKNTNTNTWEATLIFDTEDLERKLTEFINSTGKELVNIKNNIRTLDETIRSISGEFSSSVASLQDLINQGDEVILQKINTHKNEYEDLKELVEDNRDDISRILKDVSTLKERVDLNSQNIKADELKFGDLKELVEDNRGDIGEILKDISALKDRVELNSQNINADEQKLTELNNETERVKNSIIQTDLQLQTLQASISQVLTTLQEEIDEINSKIGNI